MDVTNTDNIRTVAYGSIPGSGTVTFTPIVYYHNENIDDLGEHKYVVTETWQAPTNWSKMASNNNVTVIVTDSGNGTLEAVVEYAEGEIPSFINTYTPPQLNDDIPKETTESTTEETTSETTTELVTRETAPEETTKPTTAETTPETTTEPTIKETTPEETPESTIEEIISEEPVTVESSTEPLIDESTTVVMAAEPVTEPVIETTAAALPENIEVYDEMPDGVIPLGNGWSAKYVGDGWWEIFDENGTPLGFIWLADDESIEGWNNFTRMIAVEDWIRPENPKVPRPNPQTGDNLWVMFGLLLLTVTGVAIFKKRFVK
jgi:hypothetical protein